jgi:2-polyprenyl-6-methoxyphenol hydroxylase-like FAD-dependent oxidoreductase
MVLKVVICGGGIGGLTTALCIDRLCRDYVSLEMFEQAPQYKVYWIYLQC